MAQRPLRSPRPAPPAVEPVPDPPDQPAAPAVAPVLPIHPRTRPSRAPGARRRQAQARAPRSALWYGDNLDVLREHVRAESVNLVYLDPPFNSDRAYNVIF